MFKRGLWKEQRQLEIVHSKYGQKALRKHFLTSEAGRTEIFFLDAISKYMGLNSVPKVLDTTDTYVDLEYVKGIRLHTVFMALKELGKEISSANILRANLLQRCVVEAMRIQTVIVQSLNACKTSFTIYPFQEKVLSLLDLFNHCLDLGLDMPALTTEIKLSCTYAESIDCLIPFRDAAPKNMILR
ncbi:unnamed protein product, partial [marine sediment metagenome]